jgi:hypothetical protein
MRVMINFKVMERLNFAVRRTILNLTNVSAENKTPDIWKAGYFFIFSYLFITGARGHGFASR